MTMENLEKLNYNADEWYISDSGVGKNVNTDIKAEKTKKKHSGLYNIIYVVILVFCILIYYFLYGVTSFSDWECALIAGGAGAVLISIMLLVDRKIIRKRANKNAESELAVSAADDL